MSAQPRSQSPANAMFEPMAALVPPVERVELDGPVGLVHGRDDLLAEQQHRGHRLMGQVVAWSDVECAPGGLMGTIHGVRQCVEAVAEFVCVDQRQRRPTVGVPGCDLDGALEADARREMVGRNQPLVVPEEVKERFVRRPPSGDSCRGRHRRCFEADTPNGSAHVETMRGTRSS